jgi:hypothetical protein
MSESTPMQHPLEALADVDCKHSRHYAMCLQCAATAVRPEIERLLTLIRDLADGEPCWFDHHGGCQAHGYLSLEPGERCPQGEAQELVAALDAAKEERS